MQYTQLFNSQPNSVIILQDNNELEKAQRILQFYHSLSVSVLTLPEWDVKPYSLLSPSANVVQKRANTLSELLECQAKKKQYILLTTIDALLLRLPVPKHVEESRIILEKGDEIDRDVLLEFLVLNNFHRVPEAQEIGEFAVRGSIIDVVCEEYGYRIDLFDKIKMRKFHLDSQLSFDDLTTCVIGQTREFSINETTVELFKKRYENAFAEQNKMYIDALDSGYKFSGIEHYTPFFHEKMKDIFAYISKSVKFMCSDTMLASLKPRMEELGGIYENQLVQGNDVVKPSDLYVDANHLEEKITSSIYVNNSNELRPIKIAQGVESINEHLQNSVVIISCFSQDSSKKIARMLKHRSIAHELVGDIKQCTSKNIAYVADFGVSASFEMKEYVVISENDLLGERFTDLKASKPHNNKVLSSINEISSQDYVVHKEHGIGKFLGLKAITVAKVTRDFITIQYYGDDIIYLPVENLELISKYGDSHEFVKLDKLGSAAWMKRKAILKNRIKLAAQELIRATAARKLARGVIFNIDKNAYNEFCSKFPYTETQDQLCAVDDCMADFSSGMPMNRLICGDVGFGKTEVAMRAACMVATANNKAQVVLVAPTTLLCQQHYDNFNKRFAGMGITISQLSKFVSPKEKRNIKQQIKEGSVDILITTHSIFSKDVEFMNLGLVIVDEEQHFGVKQKEKLKALQCGVHILTLSATPIPRTLQMSLIGLKELSLISTPPTNRLEVKTHVLPFNNAVLKDAIQHEINRVGRVFFVTPRIKYMHDLEVFMEKNLPGLKYVFVHGKLKTAELEDAMQKFYSGEAQVLISTNIIESGIDIPNANTLIVDRADMFGLAQLYQIRGRIGRGNTKAYAYLTLPKTHRVSKVTQERLEVLESLSNFGGGYAIASHDCDLRGYGNLLGEEQTGHIKEVGVELYNQMLEEELRRLNNEKTIAADWSVDINLRANLQIPESYIVDETLRLSIYRTIAKLESNDEIEPQMLQLEDRFGALPEDVLHLFDVVKIKISAKRAFIKKIDVTNSKIKLTFADLAAEPDAAKRVMDFVQSHKSQVAIQSNSIISINKNMNSYKEKVETVLKVIDKLTSDA